MVRARAVNPWVSKKFLAARCPGSAAASMPMQPRGAAVLDQRVDHRLPDADLARRFLDEQIGDHAEARTGAQRLDHDGAEADDDVVDGADRQQRVVAREQRAVGVVERFGPRLAFEPERAARASPPAPRA